MTPDMNLHHKSSRKLQLSRKKLRPLKKRRNLNKASSKFQRSRNNAELKKLSSKMEPSLKPYHLGMKLMFLHFQTTGIGEILKVLTTSHGTRINTSQSTVDHAGLKELPLLLLIDSTFSLKTKIQPQQDSMLKSLSTVRLVVIVKVETQVVFGNSLLTKVSQIHHASNTLLLILPSKRKDTEAVKPLINAETAPGLHVMLERHASINVGLLTTNTTTSLTTTI